MIRGRGRVIRGRGRVIRGRGRVTRVTKGHSTIIVDNERVSNGMTCTGYDVYRVCRIP